jgi:hypothetical protein
MITRTLSVLCFAALVAGCAEVSPETIAPSVSYEMAADANRTFSDRRPAAMMLQGLELSRLRALLMKRIPLNWYGAAANDLLVLALIGDEGEAEYLEQLYTHVPDARVDSGSMTAKLHTAVADIRNRRGTHSFEIAADSCVFGTPRETAANQLDALERVRLQTLLLERLAGKWDATSASDVAFLARIGDEDTALRLEAIYHKPDFHDAGNQTAVLQNAVQQIRQRLSGQQN